MVSLSSNAMLNNIVAITVRVAGAQARSVKPPIPVYDVLVLIVTRWELVREHPAAALLAMHRNLPLPPIERTDEEHLCGIGLVPHKFTRSTAQCEHVIVRAVRAGRRQRHIKVPFAIDNELVLITTDRQRQRKLKAHRRALTGIAAVYHHALHAAPRGPIVKRAGKINLARLSLVPHKARLKQSHAKHVIDDPARVCTSLRLRVHHPFTLVHHVLVLVHANRQL
mmetsp:Transcript_7904/g.20930  ORF Transcript_7904/g.20930 Transcript_7904/m.20930 type:complete len:224 (-) Transcript_7904:955-1626(-)